MAADEGTTPEALALVEVNPSTRGAFIVLEDFKSGVDGGVLSEEKSTVIGVLGYTYFRGRARRAKTVDFGVGADVCVMNIALVY